MHERWTQQLDVMREPVWLLLDGPCTIPTAGSPCMPARRREAIVASVCRVLHGRRVPGDACGLDLASMLHGACESYNIPSQICSDTKTRRLSLEHQLANKGCHALPSTDHDIH